ncbi:MAG TPA: right-handed parallel beta-helix repeat-containing protein [Acidimicrobiia bacterium]|jgi:nitrous oxidase accessory protein NosD|nr:right-handed parallel beta-helix repeat-containing protein [Acidimicrobiia bacterium]
MTVSRKRNVVIEGVQVTNPEGDCIVINRSTDIVIRDSRIGPCGGFGVRIRNSTGVILENTEIVDTSGGVYALSSRSVQVRHNRMSSAGRNPIQFDKVSGPGNLIAGNVVINLPGNTETEDSINLYRSEGSEASPIIVEQNLIRHGGSSTTGSGIMVGDHGGRYIWVRENVLIDPGQVGIGVAGGVAISVVGNVVYSGSFDWTNVGIYVWNQDSPACDDIEVRDNTVEFYNSSGARNAYYDGANCGPIAGWETNRIAEELMSTVEALARELEERR